MQTKNKRKNFILIGLMLLSLLAPVTVSARDAVIEKDKEVTLRILPQEEKFAFAGMEYEIYKVADVDNTGDFTYSLTKEFSAVANNVELNPPGKAVDWAGVANFLAGAVLQNKVSPADTALTNADGIVTFPAKASSMKPGLYLVTMKKYEKEGVTVTQNPFLVCLPLADEAYLKGETKEVSFWEYKASVVAKLGTYDKKTMSLKVAKVWDDEGVQNSRPASVTIKLFKDGVEFDQVVLKEGAWSHTWSNLPVADYVATEVTPGDYKVTVNKQGTTFTVKNAKRPPENPPGTPPSTPPTTPPPTTNVPSVLGASRALQPAVLGATRLPQTGLLWWPVPIMAGAGLLFVLAGYYLNRKTY